MTAHNSTHYNCPFCNSELSIRQGDFSIIHSCENKRCQIIGSSRFKIFIQNEDIISLNFIIDHLMTRISYVHNSTSICSIRQEEVDVNGINMPYMYCDLNSEIIIHEAPKINFKDTDHLFQKIKLWKTFS